MKKHLKPIMFLIILLIITTKVNAQTFTIGEAIDGVYYKKISTNGNGHYALARFVKNPTTNKVVYCIEPFKPFAEGLNYNVYQSTSYANYLNMSEETWRKINTVAYFGYGYQNHKDPIWYAVTQILIWRIVEPTTNSYFTSTLNGERTDIYEDKILELENMANEYLYAPNNFTFLLDNSADNFLREAYDYEYTFDPYIYIAWVNSKKYVVVTNNFAGEKTSTSYRGQFAISYFYVLNNYQSLIEVNSPPNVKITYKLISKRGNLRININNLNNIYSNCNNNNKTIYKIYTYENKFVQEFEANQEEINIGDLKYGKYYIKQESTSCSYEKDNNIYEFEISDNTSVVNINLKPYIKRININKEYCNDNVCVLEKGAKFIIYDDNKEFEVITNEDGKTYLDIGMGSYKLKQIQGKDGYSFINEINLNINDYETNNIYLNLKNNIIKNNLTIFVKDNLDNELDNIKICLYNENKEIIECKYTNEGQIIFNNLVNNTYYIKQINALDNYEYNNDFKKINLDEIKEILIINYLKENNYIEENNTNLKELKSEKEESNYIEITNNLDEEIDNKENYLPDTYINNKSVIPLIIINLIILIFYIFIYEKSIN